MNPIMDKKKNFHSQIKYFKLLNHKLHIKDDACKTVKPSALSIKYDYKNMNKIF